MNLSNNYIHAGPIIRKEGEYEQLTISQRRKAIEYSINLIRKLPLKYHTFMVERKKTKDPVQEVSNLAKSIKDFLIDNSSFFESFKCVKVYYDNGQIQLSKLLAAVLTSSLKPQLILKKVDSPRKYILFQIADVCCTLELIKFKLNNKLFKNTEKHFFLTEKKFLKDFYNKILPKKI